MNEPPPSSLVRTVCAGESAVVAEFPARIDPVINQQVTTLADRLRAQWGAILRDVVAGYCTVTAYFDPLRVDAPWLEAEMRAAARLPFAGEADSGAVVDVPVCYEDELAPDLDDVAAFGGCSREEVVALHSGATYRVYMVGFIPGFAYLAEVDPRIAAPRRATPRATVPPGSVAIAGGQTGVYPAETPGGWNIIGRTAQRPYDARRDRPCLFAVGDQVRFHPVTRGAFERGTG